MLTKLCMGIRDRITRPKEAYLVLGFASLMRVNQAHVIICGTVQHKTVANPKPPRYGTHENHMTPIASHPDYGGWTLNPTLIPKP